MLVHAALTAWSQLKGDAGSDLDARPKLVYVHVFDQGRLESPTREPVPLYFQRGEESWKLDFHHVSRWLSGTLEKSVTAVYTAAAIPSSASAPWDLQSFRKVPKVSPFVQGAVVVCCCDGEPLRGDLAEALAALVSSRAFKRVGVRIASAGPRRDARQGTLGATRADGALAAKSYRTACLPPAVVAKVEPVSSADPAACVAGQSSRLQVPRQDPRRAGGKCEVKAAVRASSAAYVVSDAEAEDDAVAKNDVAAEKYSRSETSVRELEDSEGRKCGWIVDNSTLRASMGGLRELRHKSLSARPPCALVPWGAIVHGVDEGDGWLRLPNGHYMPIHIDGIPVLTPERHVANATLSPEDFTRNPSKSGLSVTSEVSTWAPSMPESRNGAFDRNTETDAFDGCTSDEDIDWRGLQIARDMSTKTEGEAPEKACEASTCTLPKTRSRTGAFEGNDQTHGSDASESESGAVSRAVQIARDMSTITEAEAPEKASPTWIWSIFEVRAAASWCIPARCRADGGHSDDEGVPPPTMLLS